MSHGFGNERTTGIQSFDPIGGMGHLTGIGVEVEAAAAYRNEIRCSTS